MSHENVLPASVRKQIEAAEAIYKDVYKEPDPEAAAPEAKPDPAPTPEAKPDPAPTPEAKPEDSFEHKFKVLQGKYNKEVPRLHAQLRDSQHENGKLKDRISSLEDRVKQLMDTPKEPEAPALTQDEIDQFGPDLIDIIRRVAKQETGVVLDSKLKPVTETVKQVQEKVAHTTENEVKSARERMLKDLADAVPEWEKQNTDPEFLEWLDETDSFSGKARAELLADAYRRNDGARVIAFFKGFHKENVVATDDQPTPDSTKVESPDGLEELVAPGTPKTGTTGAQNESGKRIWTQREIKEFYAYKNEFIKKFPNRELPEDVVMLERDIFKAQSENRIKP